MGKRELRRECTTHPASGITEIDSKHPDGVQPLKLRQELNIEYVSDLELNTIIVTDIFTDGSEYITLAKSGLYCTFLTEKGSFVHLHSETLVRKGDNGIYGFAQNII